MEKVEIFLWCSGAPCPGINCGSVAERNRRYFARSERTYEAAKNVKIQSALLQEGNISLFVAKMYFHMSQL